MNAIYAYICSRAFENINEIEEKRIREQFELNIRIVRANFCGILSHLMANKLSVLCTQVS